MSSAHPHPLVDDYLRRLDGAAEGLPTGRRAELVTEIGEHIREALGASGAGDEATVRTVLDRLGAPEEIVAAAAADAAPDGGPAQRLVAPAEAQPRASPARGLGGLEIAAIVTLVVGAVVVPVANVVAGLVLAWLSTVWTRAEKLIATAVPSAVTLVAALALAARAAGWWPASNAADTGASLELLPPSTELLVTAAVAAPVLGGAIAAIYLAMGPRRRSRRTV